MVYANEKDIHTRILTHYRLGGTVTEEREIVNKDIEKMETILGMEDHVGRERR